jgi:hypothetical protein
MGEMASLNDYQNILTINFGGVDDNLMRALWLIMLLLQVDKLLI